MTNLIVELSKYLLMILMVGYVFFQYFYYRKKTDAGRRHMVGMQNFFLFCVHFLGYLILFLKTEDSKILVMYAIQLVFFAAYILLYRAIYKNASRQLVTNACMLLTIGFIIQTRLSYTKAFKQMIIALAAAAVTLLVPYIIRYWKKICKGTWIYGGIGILLLFLVCTIGRVEYGAKLSLGTDSFSLQPAEFVKITFVFFIAGMFRKRTTFLWTVLTTALAAVHVLLLVLSKDLGTALTLFVPFLFMLFVATRNWWYLLSGTAVGTGAAIGAYYVFDHVRVRVSVWLDPWSDITNRGWQLAQSLFAIGTGGWFGMGIYQGMPYQIPVALKDFVFAAISEEMGAVAAIALLLIYLSCILQFFLISTWMENRYYKVIALGLGSIFSIQIFLNVAGVIRLIPSTGLTLPFVSYGGSSVLGTFILFGIMQGLYIMKMDEDQKLEKEQERDAAGPKKAAVLRETVSQKAEGSKKEGRKQKRK